MIQSGGRRLLLLDPPRMIQTRASGLISTDDALVVLWPLLLVLPRMIESWALHGLVTLRCITKGSSSWLFPCFSTASSSWQLFRFTAA